MSNSHEAERQIIAFSNDALGLGEYVPEFEMFERGGKKVMAFKNVPVFRSGTFRSAYGEQKSYDDETMRLFVANFDHLKAQGILDKVPVRAGHRSYTGYMDSLIGYVTGISTAKKKIRNGQEFTFLLADYEILDKNAQEKIDSGLWVNRSSEIGEYRTNDEVVYSPVFLGFAYVDMPAVEHLNEKFSHYLTEEVMTGTSLPTPPAPGAPATAPAAPVLQEYSLGGVMTSDPVAVATYISGMETKVAAYERAEVTRVATEREDFCKKLAADGKILASNLDGQIAFAKSLTQDQFSQWSKQQEALTPHPALGEHGVATQAGEPAAPKSPADEAYEADLQIVNTLAEAGVNHEEIKRHASYSRVVAKDSNFALPTPTFYGTK